VVIDLRARLSAATVRTEALLNVSGAVGVELFELEVVRRRLVDHGREYERIRVPLRRREIVKLIKADVSVFATGYKKLEPAVERPVTT
jgi:hypothetical protein